MCITNVQKYENITINGFQWLRNVNGKLYTPFYNYKIVTPWQCGLYEPLNRWAHGFEFKKDALDFINEILIIDNKRVPIWAIPKVTVESLVLLELWRVNFIGMVYRGIHSECRINNICSNQTELVAPTEYLCIYTCDHRYNNHALMELLEFTDKWEVVHTIFTKMHEKDEC